MQTMEQLVGKVLTETKALQTPIASVNTTDWAKWFKFSLDGSPPIRRQLEAMVTAAARFTRAVKEQRQPYWLTLLGKSGAGKTYLAKGIWDWYRKSELFRADMNEKKTEIVYPGSWVFWPRLAADLLGNMCYGELEDLQTEKLVVFDEIGSDRDPSGHVRDCLARVLTGRVGKWTILTSNKTLGDIQRDIDTRIASRMLRGGSVVVDVDVPDYNVRTA